MEKEVIKRNKTRKGIFLSLAMLGVIAFYMLLFIGPDNSSPRMQDKWAYMVMGNVLFIGITTMCAIAKHIYIGVSYDMNHVWIFPTIGFNGKSMYIIWLRFEIFVTY
jgi:hypothetical protein